MFRSFLLSLSQFQNWFVHFVGSQDIHAQSTDMNRSKMSLQLVLAGLNPSNLQPIPFTFEKLFDDSLLLVVKPCPRFHEELERAMKEEVKTELDEHLTMFKELTNHTGWNIETPLHVQHLYGIFKSQKKFGLKLPEWAKNFYPQRLQELVIRASVYNAYNDELKRLKGGVFVKKAIEDWEQKTRGELKQKMFIYSAHDASGEFNKTCEVCPFVS